MPTLEELRRYPHLTRSLLGFLEDPVAVITRGRVVVYVNPAFAKHFRCTWESAIGQPLEKLIPRFLEVRIRQYLEGLTAAASPRHFWAKSYGQSLRVSLAPVVARNRLIGATVCLWEASSEAEVKRMNVSLFRALLEDVAAPVSTLEVCLQGQGNHPARLVATRLAMQEHLVQINEGLTRFKEYAEILFGQIVPAQVTFRPLQLLGLARKTLASAAKSREVFLEEAHTRDLPDLQGDPAYLNRILGLVVDFVIKNVPAGQMVIMAVDVLNWPDGSPRLVYSITGTGWVPKEALLRSLTDHRQEFYLGKSDEEKRQILRLFIARRLVQALNGSFTPAAHEKAGTTFSISIPVSIYSMPPETEADSENAPAS